MWFEMCDIYLENESINNNENIYEENKPVKKRVSFFEFIINIFKR